MSGVCGSVGRRADSARERFFQQLTEEMKDQMIRYRKTLDVGFHSRPRSRSELTRNGPCQQIERGLMSLQRIQHMPTPQGGSPHHSDRPLLTPFGTAIATAVSNNQETIMSLAGEIAGIEERIKNLAAFYRCV